MLTRPDLPAKEPSTAQLEAFIAEGGYGPGDRLPPERDLIARLGLGRAALRRALEHLERRGLIWRHVGKGTFVAGPRDGLATPADPFSEIGKQLTPFRMMRARICVEPAITREAAMNASHEGLAAIEAAMAHARAASSWSEYERQDDGFHRAIAEAADNALLLGLFDSLNAVRREVALGAVERTTARPPAEHTSFAEHEAITAAIRARDPDAAYAGMRKHLQSVAARLFGDM
jgi:DNA-binding FadR family transcriptional regulator